MRPPRPWPSWRRARSESMSSGRSSSPAGRPSRTAVRPGPCDSPAVVKRSAIGAVPYWRFSALFGLASDARAVQQTRQERVVTVLNGARRLGLGVGGVALGLGVRDVLPVEREELDVVLLAAVLGDEAVLVAAVRD